MSLISCPECGKEISDNSEKCIHCGYPLKTKKHARLSKKIILISLVCIISGIAIGGGIYYLKSRSKTLCIVPECNNIAYSGGYCLDHYNQIKAGQDVMNSVETVNVESSNNTSNDSVDSSVEEDKPISFNKNKKITTDTCEFTLLRYDIDKVIEPAHPTSSYYHYYEAGSGNVFIDVVFSIKNLESKAVSQSDILDSVKIIYKGEYEYWCSFVTIDNDGDFEGFTSLYGINPLETMEYHMLAEVPNEIQSSGGSLVCRVEVGGLIYECVLR